ncbi:hypothetical protein JMUB7539_27350 [Staphylococcus aureus]
MIAHDIEVIRNGSQYRVSDNPFTYNHLEVVEYNVTGACLLYTSPSPRD